MMPFHHQHTNEVCVCASFLHMYSIFMHTKYRHLGARIIEFRTPDPAAYRRAHVHNKISFTMFICIHCENELS